MSTTNAKIKQIKDAYKSIHETARELEKAGSLIPYCEAYKFPLSLCWEDWIALEPNLKAFCLKEYPE